MQNNTHTSAALKKVVTWARSLNIPESIIPSDILELENLETLNLYDLKLTTLPYELSALSNLKKLYLASNRFSELPPVVCKLKQLEVLWIMNNSIEVLPEELLNLCNLKELVAFDNNIITLPDLIQLKKLDYLVLSYNQLSPAQTTALEKEFTGEGNFSDQRTAKKFQIERLTNETLSEAKQLRDKVFIDIPQVEQLTLDAAISKEQYEEVYEENAINSMQYWVGKNREGTVIGLIGIYSEPEDDENSCWLGWFCVDDDYRGYGYGKELLEYAQTEAIILGKKYLHLYTEDTKECHRAIELYKAEGFKE